MPFYALKKLGWNRRMCSPLRRHLSM